MVDQLRLLDDIFISYITKFHRQCDLHPGQLLSLEATSLRSRCRQGLVPSEAGGESLFHATVLASAGFLAVFGIPWFVKSLTPISALTFMWHPPDTDACIQISPFYKDTGHTGLGAFLTPA